MKIRSVIFVIALSSIRPASVHQTSDCHDIDQEKVLPYYISLINDVHAKLFKTVALTVQDNFVYSPNSIYEFVLALAEGAEADAQQRIFEAVSYPYKPPNLCLREKLYEIAADVERGEKGITLDRNRVILFDESVNVNETWVNYINLFGEFDYDFAPLLMNKHKAARQAEVILGTNVAIPKVFISGNSILLDSLDYRGNLGANFKVTKYEIAPFYNSNGEIIDNVEYVTLRAKAKLAYIRSLNTKILEFPIGNEGRYNFRFMLKLDNKPLDDTIREYNSNCLFENLYSQSESLLPISITLPRFNMTALIEYRTILEGLGLNALWTDEAATRYVSNPAALPGSYFQRVTVIMDNFGDLQFDPDVNASKQPTGLNPIVNDEFTANKPFLFGIFDAKTETTIFNGGYFRPKK